MYNWNSNFTSAKTVIVGVWLWKKVGLLLLFIEKYIKFLATHIWTSAKTYVIVGSNGLLNFASQLWPSYCVIVRKGVWEKRSQKDISIYWIFHQKCICLYHIGLKRCRRESGSYVQLGETVIVNAEMGWEDWTKWYFIKDYFITFSFRPLLQGRRCVLKDCSAIADNTVLPPETVVPPFTLFSGSPGDCL